MISIQNLRKTYGDGREALRGIDLEIGEGMLGLLGPNGAGKTTFLSLLVLSLEPTTGRRVYFGLDAAIARNRPLIRERIGFLPQSFHPIGHLSGLEYLIHCASLRKLSLTRHEIELRARRLLDAVDLSEASKRRSGTYSGGMRRRLGIAQALIHKPTLIVVDEPTAGLDPEERIRFRNLIAEVAEQTAVLLSTHIVEDIEATCDRVAVIGDGRLLFDGQPSTLMTDLADQLWSIDSNAVIPAGVTIVGRRVEGADQRLLLYAQSPPAGAQPEEISLESAYCAFLTRLGFNPYVEASA